MIQYFNSQLIYTKNFQFSSLHEVSRSCKSSFSDTQSTKANFTIKEGRSFYLKINSTLCWPVYFKLPIEVQQHKAFQILFKNLRSSPKLIKNTSHQMTQNTDSLLSRFRSQSLKAIPKSLASFVFIKAQYTGKQLLKLKHALIKIEANLGHTKSQVLLKEVERELKFLLKPSIFPNLHKNSVLRS